MRRVTLVTDGSWLPKTRVGGWACLVRCRGVDRLLSGFSDKTTSNRMELTAAIEGLRSLTGKCQVEVVTDSRYLVDGMTLWVPRWKRHNWRKADGGWVLNKDLWLELKTLAAQHRITFTWVKAHKDHEDNNRVDRKARARAEEAEHLYGKSSTAQDHPCNAAA